MTLKACLFAVLISCFLLSPAFSEMRPWSDKKGNIIEAELVKASGNKVILRKQNGKQITIPISGLCDEDRSFLVNSKPPELKIAVEVEEGRKSLRAIEDQRSGYVYEIKSETVVCSVNVKKVNREPCTSEFKWEIFIIAHQNNENKRKLIGLTTGGFSFKEAALVTFESDLASVKYSYGTYLDKESFRYEGYIVFIKDSSGNVIASESNQSTYIKHLDQIKDWQVGSEYDRKFEYHGKASDACWTSRTTI